MVCSDAQSMAGVYDFGEKRAGEKRGSWTPAEWLAAILIVMTISLGLAVSIGLCYYVKKRQTRITSAPGTRRRSFNSSGMSANMDPNQPVEVFAKEGGLVARI